MIDEGFYFMYDIFVSIHMRNTLIGKREGEQHLFDSGFLKRLD